MNYLMGLAILLGSKYWLITLKSRLCYSKWIFYSSGLLQVMLLFEEFWQGINTSYNDWKEPESHVPPSFITDLSLTQGQPAIPLIFYSSIFEKLK